MRNLLTLFFGLLSILTTAQNNGFRIGMWRVHLPLSQSTCLETVDDKIYVGTSGGLYYLERDDHAMTFLNKVSGLSDIQITAMVKNQATGKVVVAYSNGNIDILTGNTVKNLNALYIKTFPADKRIYCAYSQGDRVYLGTGFGILEIDMNLLEIKNTFLIGKNSTYRRINAITSDTTNLYAATDAGIYYVAWNSPNLSDFQYWKVDSSWAIKNVTLLTSINQKLVVGSNDSIYVKSGNQFSYFTGTAGAIRNFMVRDNKLHVANFYRGLVFDSTLNLIAQTRLTDKLKNAVSSYYDSDKNFWVCDGDSGLVFFDQFAQRHYLPNGPSSNMVFDIDAKNGEVLVSGGGYDKALNNDFSKAGFYRFDGTTWFNYNEENGSGFDQDTRDFIGVKINAKTKKTYVSSWTRGLLELENGKVVNHYTDKNSNLVAFFGSNPGNDFVRVGGIDVDSKGNLWMINYGGNLLLKVLYADGTWGSFPLGGALTKATSVTVDQLDQKWVIIPGYGLSVQNSDNTDRKVLTASGGSGGLHNTNINCLTVDQDGTVWVGTNEGPTAFYSPSIIFGNYAINAQRVKIGQNAFDNYVDYLLEDQVINDIAVDGANRKWFCTNNGVWLMSADGQTQILHFTAENSPLLSNVVTSIAINGKNGEVFFGTDKGLCSYRSNASDGELVQGDVVVYPNPVRPDYNGIITIQGLVTNAWFKVVDVTGQLVYQSRANGGTAVWNGTDLKGNRVSTGVYLIMTTDDYGAEKQVSKVLFVK